MGPNFKGASHRNQFSETGWGHKIQEKHPTTHFHFKINPKEIIKRLKQRKVKNKYDKSNLLFHQKVIQGYKKIATPKRYITVDASLSKDIIHKNIIKKLKL